MQVVNGLKALLNPGNVATPSYISAFDSYNTALAFVQALGHTQDSNGNTVQVSSPSTVHAEKRMPPSQAWGLGSTVFIVVVAH